MNAIDLFAGAGGFSTGATELMRAGPQQKELFE